MKTIPQIVNVPNTVDYGSGKDVNSVTMTDTISRTLTDAEVKDTTGSLSAITTEATTFEAAAGETLVDTSGGFLSSIINLTKVSGRTWILWLLGAVAVIVVYKIVRKRKRR